nr:shade [Pyrrhocoris apterus]
MGNNSKGEWTMTIFRAIGGFFDVILKSVFEQALAQSNLQGIDHIPGPRSYPVIGTRYIYYTRYKLSKLHEAHADLYKRYGPVVKEVGLWNIPIVSLYGKHPIEFVLRHSIKHPIRPPTEVTATYRASRPDRYTSLGLTNEQGEVWHTLRTALTPPIMSSRTLSMFFPELLSVTEDFIRLLKCSRDSNDIIQSFDEMAGRFGLESTCSFILGRRLGVLDETASELSIRLAKAVKDQFCAVRDTYYGLPFWKVFPSSSYDKYVSAEETIYDIISEMVENAELEEQEYAEENCGNVFMSILRSPGLDIREKKAAIIDFIAGGISTVGNTLVFLFYLIAKNKRCQNKLLEEINSLGKDITEETLSRANYLKACITEAHRLLPTTPCLAKIMDVDLVAPQYLIPKGTVILCQTWQACLMEENFENALEFKPERWFDERGNLIPSPPLVAPFGAGRRGCPGKRFVERELQVLLTEMVRNFEIDFDGELGLQFEFLMAPESPTPLRLTDRR